MDDPIRVLSNLANVKGATICKTYDNNHYWSLHSGALRNENQST